ncbi:MAG: hypothetical protein BM555_01425 [Crocinitomix sp. MedPE-SWsnd]|nr:MAG: hypothetical protein BM555_01425 [Crocinitomix sp. MedPE-SWsnd]
MSQNLLGKLNFTKVEFNNDSSLAVISQKKKMGLFDVKKQEFILKPSKSTILPSFERDWYIILGKKENKVYEHGANMFHPFSQYSNDISGFSIKELENNRILIQDYDLTIWDPDKFGENRLVQRGYQKSGVFNSSANEWEIKNDYERIYEINNRLVCRKDDSVWVEVSTEEEEFWNVKEMYDTHYDVFENKGDGYQKVGADIKNSEDGLKSIYSGMQFEMHDNLVILKDGDKYGVIRFNLFELTDRFYSYLDTSTILKTEQKFATIGHQEICVAYQSQDDSIHILLNDREHNDFYTIAGGKSDLRLLFKDDWLSLRKMDGEYEHLDHVEYYESSTEYNFGIELVDSNRVLVTDYYLESPEPVYDEYGEQIFDENGDFVYEESGGIVQESGVIDKNTGEWILNPKYIRTFPLPNGHYVVQEGVTLGITGGYRPSLTSNYHLLNQESEIIETRESKSEFWENENFLKLLDGRGDDVKLLVSPTLKDYNSDEYAPLHNYSTKDGKMKLLSQIEDFDQLYEAHEAEFIYRNQEFNHWVTMDSGVWKLNFSDTSFVLDNPSSPIEIHHAKGGECRRVIQISAEIDTTVLCKVDDNPACDKDIFPVTLTLTSFGDSMIIVNDVYRAEYEKLDEWGEAYFLCTEDYAGSAVWKKDEEENWINVTPYYARVDVLPNGFLAKTRRNDGGLVIEEWDDGFASVDEFGNLELNGVEEERYLWLKSNLEAKSFMDYYDFPLIEDLGFGVKVCTDNGCMLVTYSGIALTDDVWYNFRIEDERIIGTKLIPLDWGYDDTPTEYDAVDVMFEMLTLEDLEK